MKKVKGWAVVDCRWKTIRDIALLKSIVEDCDCGATDVNSGIHQCLTALNDACRRENLLGAVVQGWCSDKNKHKEMDADLAEAIYESIRRHLGLEDMEVNNE